MTVNQKKLSKLLSRQDLNLINLSILKSLSHEQQEDQGTYCG